MAYRTLSENIIIILYVTGAVLLFVAAYVIYISKFRKRGTLKAMNDVELQTSRYDVYDKSSQFLLILPKSSKVKLDLLSSDEKLIRVLKEGNFESGQHMVDFDINDLENGIYFLSLISDHANLLRRIEVRK